MIDPSLLIDDFAETARRLQRRGTAPAEAAAARDAVVARNALLREIEDLRAARNRASKEIGRLMASGARDEAEALKAEVAAQKDTLATLEPRLREAEETARDRLLRLPNAPDDACPDGADESANRVVRTEGFDADKYAGRTYRPHWEVAGELGIYDQERAAKITGSMFAVLRGQGARLLRALVHFALDLNSARYQEHLVPTFVNSETFTATGHLPKFAVDAYRVAEDDLWAIPTGEVPLMGLHRDEILDGDSLPRRYMTHTSCFRREAGAAGKDTRGLQRLHEFHKVELVKLCRPEQAADELAAMLEDAARALATLGLPYRVVDLCAGDLSFGSARTYDLEVYAPGVERWLEVSSVSTVTDFQARRGNIRFRAAAGERPEFVHTLNGSGLATPRVWAAVVEHGQQPDGTIRVPEALVPFMGSDVIGPA